MMPVPETILLIIVLLFVIEMRIRLRSFGVPKVAHKGEGVVVDTSALIDGRIIDVAKANFLPTKVVIPKVILNELQLLADGRDAYKRERARLGLDVVAELQLLKTIEVVIPSIKVLGNTTDEQILRYASKHRLKLCTNDFNLNKVAVAEKVAILNINELAQALRPVLLPGDIIEVKILQKGEVPGQGVGYMPDGTMTVVTNSAHLKGKVVVAVVERMIQTKAGKMLFANPRK